MQTNESKKEVREEFWGELYDALGPVDDALTLAVMARNRANDMLRKEGLKVEHSDDLDGLVASLGRHSDTGKLIGGQRLTDPDGLARFLADSSEGRLTPYERLDAILLRALGAIQDINAYVRSEAKIGVLFPVSEAGLIKYLQYRLMEISLGEQAPLNNRELLDNGPDAGLE